MFDIWQEIFGTIQRNKLRTALTGFAVAWGIFMLIVLLGAGNGLINAFEENSAGTAFNTIRVYGGTTAKSFDGLKEGRRISLDNNDLGLTGTRFPERVEHIGATLYQSGVNVSFGQEYVNTGLYGVYPNYLTVRTDNKITLGRFLNERDLAERRKVIVLHKKSAEVLFRRGADPIGKSVNAGGIVYRVVGVYSDGEDSSDSDAFIPFSTLQTIYDKGDKLNYLYFTTKGLTTEELNSTFETDYRKVMGAKHRFDADDVSALRIRNRYTDYLRIEKAKYVLRVAIWVIGIFTLLSGIVGVSNIMLITVRERTHEFGIRKALGAKPRSILWLIILESVTITTLFGYVGMVAGIGVTEWLDGYFSTRAIVDVGIASARVFSNPTVDLGIALQATLTLIVAGTLAGFFPAWKATRIKPIEALRAD